MRELQKDFLKSYADITISMKSLKLRAKQSLIYKTFCVNNGANNLNF